MEVQYDYTKMTFVDESKSDAYVVFYKNVKRVRIFTHIHSLCFDLLGEKEPFCVPIPNDMCLQDVWSEVVNRIDEHANPGYDVTYQMKKTRKSNKKLLEGIHDRLEALSYVDHVVLTNKRRKY